MKKKALGENPWFSSDSIDLAVESLLPWFEKDRLTSFSDPYPVVENPKTIGMVLAGNIPLVGLHDLVCVLLSGHHAEIKLSSKDSVLMKFLLGCLEDFAPDLKDIVKVVPNLKGMDAFIGTGSDNTNRYFESYFGSKPHIFRRNRTSIAVLKKNASSEQIKALGRDIFSFYGFGCRNVSKVFFEEGFDITRFLDELQSFKDLIDHNKYAQNYEYRRAIYLTAGQRFFDSGFFILKEERSPFSRISELNYEFFSSVENLNDRLKESINDTQVLIGWELKDFSTCDYGESQQPGLEDFADNVDTMQFLADL